MRVSIIICSRDRTLTLVRTLESIFSPSNLEESGWELIVVYGPEDSGETRALCRRFQERHPDRFRYLLESRPGKSHALNSGIAIARGDLLALTDDDVICCPDYLRNIRRLFEQSSIEGAQGRVFLDCEGGQPAWMGRELAAFMSQRDFGDEAFDWNDNLTGTNMIVKRRSAIEAGGFSPQIGASAAGFMEDSEFSMRLRQAGCRFVYAPGIAVRHQLPRARLTRRFFRERYFRWGRSQAYLCPLPAPLWRMTVYALRRALWRSAKAQWLRVRGRPAQAFFQACETRQELGFVFQHFLFQTGRAAAFDASRATFAGGGADPGQSQASPQVADS